MSRTTDLREALALWGEDHQRIGDDVLATARGLVQAVEYLPIIDAAEFALRVWEGDQQLVEQGGNALIPHLPENVQPYAYRMAADVLAAITEEEK